MKTLDLDSVNTTNLRERTIERIKAEGLDMAYWMPSHNPCRTACCLAGNIILAAGLTSTQVFDLDHSYSDIAFMLWEKEYGTESASKLGFLGEFAGEDKPLHEITPEEGIAHLLSV